MNLTDALQIAAKSHAGQVDKDGAPYIWQPSYVLMHWTDKPVNALGMTSKQALLFEATYEPYTLTHMKTR